MHERLCNVALPLPLRTTFTYRVPERLAGDIQLGSRVVVPFRKKSLVGVVTEWVDKGPHGTKLREVQKVVDVVPALTLKLLELGQWIASYYVAPIGEVYRAMLPPVTEVRSQQTVLATAAGREAAAALFARNDAQANLFQRLSAATDGLPLQAAIRAGVPLDELLKLQ